MATAPHVLAHITAASSGRVGMTWRSATVAVALAMVWIIACMYSTAAGMAGIWARSDTFMHGFLIAPVSLWLVLRMRHRLVALEPSPSYPTLVLVAGAGLAWAMGYLAAVDVVAQFALVALLVLAVPALLGWTVARAMAFPLGFLFFMVPFGEFLLSPLMTWTANFTVAAVRASGVPVYQEGLQFVLPSGRWSVVEACSGVRYLIASVVAGSLFAYLNYRSPRRRAIFAVISVIVPIVANWLRAYMIVMLGHLSSNTLAVGVDHLVYGWLFFGVVLLLLFWVGSFWREDLDEAPPAAGAASPVRDPGGEGGLGRALPALAAFAAVVAIWPLAARALVGGGTSGAPALATMEAPTRWAAAPGGLTDWTPRFAGAPATSHVTYRRDADKVGLYVAYYRDQREGHKVVSAGNVLVPSDDPFYRVRDARRMTPGLARGPTEVREAIVKRADGATLVTWQWYWVDGHTTASDVTAKLLGLRERVTGRGDDGAIVVASVLAGTREEARPVLAAFVADAYPALERTLERTQEAR